MCRHGNMRSRLYSDWAPRGVLQMHGLQENMPEKLARQRKAASPRVKAESQREDEISFLI